MLATHEQITLTYFIRHKGCVFSGMIAGLALVLLLHWLALSHSSIPSIWLVQLVLCCPFGLRTPQGRAWWLAYLCLVMGGTGVYYTGAYSPFALLCAIVVIIAMGLGVCLRWNKP